MVLVVKNLLASAGSVLIPGSGRCPGEGHDHPLQYSCLEHLMDRGAWWATVHRITKSQIQLKRLSMHSMTLQFPLKSYSQPCGIRWLMQKYCQSIPCVDLLSQHVLEEVALELESSEKEVEICSVGVCTPESGQKWLQIVYINKTYTLLPFFVSGLQISVQSCMFYLT